MNRSTVILILILGSIAVAIWMASKAVKRTAQLQSELESYRAQGGNAQDLGTAVWELLKRAGPPDKAGPPAKKEPFTEAKILENEPAT